MSRTRIIERILTMAIVGLGIIAATGVAKADQHWDHDGWHGGWHQEDEDNGWHGGYIPPPPIYSAPPSYYAPQPPTYYAQQPPTYRPPPTYYVPPPAGLLRSTGVFIWPYTI